MVGNLKHLWFYSFVSPSSSALVFLWFRAKTVTQTKIHNQIIVLRNIMVLYLFIIWFTARYSGRSSIVYTFKTILYAVQKYETLIMLWGFCKIGTRFSNHALRELATGLNSFSPTSNKFLSRGIIALKLVQISPWSMVGKHKCGVTRSVRESLMRHATVFRSKIYDV